MSRLTKKQEQMIERRTAARIEVNRRVQMAVDRLSVAMGMTAGSSAVVAQVLHAVHFLERGYAEDSRTAPQDALDFRLTQSVAEELATKLAWFLTDAERAPGTFGDAE